jgi:uncharacterized protein (TIGR03492 family)
VKRVLFVTNGHGEAAIAGRIVLDLRELAPQVQIDHLALVGDRTGSVMRDVGPRRTMPSGGLIAMGNARNLARDLRAGLLGLTLAQARFLLRSRGSYEAVVAVGDVYALAMSFFARLPTIFVGTAKSIDVARYGAFEERLLARATVCFVRDEPTASALRAHGLKAEAANAIVDLLSSSGDGADIARAIDRFEPVLALFPGSRDSAYADALFLLDVTRELAMRHPALGGVLSIAEGLDSDHFVDGARRCGWHVERRDDESIPFVLRCNGRTVVRAWRGDLGSLLANAVLVLGQAGTANEAAAAAAVPVVAFEQDRDRRERWYRQRQRGLLGEALAVFPAELPDAVAGVAALLEDPQRRERMGSIGRARMGQPGSARRIAERIAELVAS